MQQSKYVQLLRTLTKSERTEFGKYLRGLYGTQKQMLTIHAYINKEAVVNYNSSKLDKKYVLGKKKDKLVASAGRLERHLSDLFLYLEEFLRWKMINRDSSDNFKKDQIQLEIYKERQLSDFFFKALEKARAREEENLLDMWHHLQLGILDSMLHYSFETIKVSKKDIALPSFLAHLEQFIKEVKTKAQCELEQRKNILSKNDEVEFDESKVFLKVYQAILGLIRNEETQSYEQVKKLVNDQLEKFCEEDCSAIITYLINYCIGQVKSGQLIFSKEVLYWYKILIEQLSIFENRRISHTDFNNIIEVACKTEELSWAKDFIERYQAFIQPKNLGEPSQAIGKALIAFEEKAYEKVILLLNNVQFTDMDHAIRARWLLLCSHYEVHPKDKQCEDFMAAYHNYFTRNGIWHDDIKNGSLNLLKILRKMTKPYLPEVLKQEIQDTSPLVYKIWLLKKLDPHFQI